jgi:hypothetical protein
MFDNNGNFLLAMFEFFIFFAYLMCLFWIFGDLFRSKDLSGWAKTFWVIFIVVFPFLGLLFYLIFRGGGMTERAIAQQKDIQEQQAAYVKSVAGSSGGSPADQIASAKALLDAGTISQAEFDGLKAKALA